MILTCPQCATGYFVSDAEGSAAEATCAACGARWAMLAVSAQAGASSEPALKSDRASGPDLTPTAALPKSFRARAFSRRRLRQAAIVGAAWGGAVAGLMFLAGASVVFRDQVARIAPPAARLYAALGLPVNRIGLVIEGLRAEPGLQDGHATLGVTGVIRNVQDRAVAAPPLRVQLLNANGRAVAGQLAAAPLTRIAPGETRRFAVAIFDPPLTAYNLQVTFAPEVKGRIAMAQPLRQAPPPETPPPGLRGALAPDAPQPADATTPDTPTPHG